MVLLAIGTCGVKFYNKSQLRSGKLNLAASFGPGRKPTTTISSQHFLSSKNQEEGADPMAVVLDHTIVPAHDKEASARFLARILGLHYGGAVSHFAPVQINDSLTLDFDDDTQFESHHYAFKVDEAEFDGIYERVRAEGISYGSGPRSLDDMKINRRRGGRGFYFRDPNGHIMEVLTA
jgi:catechol 2,3-dioxygenase-like lactoylglutathione lyase family enzyme